MNMAVFNENEYRGVSLRLLDVFVRGEVTSPSQTDGLSAEEETWLRVEGCRVIADAGRLLRLPQVAVACAQVLYHRFYYCKSFVRHNWEHYAMSCVFLSAKIEECCRRLRDVVNVFVHIRQLREQKILKTLSIPEYAELKPYIIKAERRVLKELGFCVHGKHSHKLICIYLHILGQDKNKDLVQLSWNYMNDSLRTTVFCRFQPEIIACACIYLGALHLQFPLGQNWFEIFGASEEMLESISLSILELYAIKNINVVALELKLAELKKEQIEARNKKIAQDKKDELINTHHNSGDNKCRRSDDENKRGKENMEKNKERHRRSHKRRSISPKRERNHRSRSPKTKERSRSRSNDKKKSYKQNHVKEYSEKKYRKSYESGGEEYISDKHQSRKVPNTTTKERRRSISPNNSSGHNNSDKQQHYRKRRRSSSNHSHNKTSSFSMCDHNLLPGFFGPSKIQVRF